MSPGDLSLNHLSVLFLDCQTTGANPDQGNILEIGWMKSHIRHDKVQISIVNQPAVTYLLKLPSNDELSPRIQKITGISPNELESAQEPAYVYGKLMDIAQEIRRLNISVDCPLIIHFARFETPFLNDLYRRYSQTETEAFPFSLICTHKIAQRLIPELPRKSLRAVAGYFGYSAPKERRCKVHLLATAYIWQSMLTVLVKDFGILTLNALKSWLNQPAGDINRERTYPMTEEEKSKIPDAPGIYRMLRSNGSILYIGKAGSLRSRVKSYFYKSRRHPEHILEMLSQAKRIDTTETGSLLEASLLESDEIKHHSPPYNIALQAKRRRISFCSDDFTTTGSEPGPGFRVGPLASADAVKPLSALLQILSLKDRSEADHALLCGATGIPLEFAPDRETLIAGFEIFFSGHGNKLEGRHPPSAVRRLGKQLWINNRKKEKDSEARDDVKDPPNEHIWTPDSVNSRIESALMYSTREIRRGRWLAILSESSLAWEECVGGEQHRFLLVFNRGRIIERKHEIMADLPVPPGYSRNLEERQMSFDACTFDRMSILSSEIKRLLSMKVWVRLCTGAKRYMDEFYLRKLYEQL